jgi:cytochrome P450
MELLVFILAGFGVANSMSITFLMLALYPDVQTKLRAEIERVCVNEVKALLIFNFNVNI